MSQLSVIIPTYNDERIIQKTLEALARLVNIDEIIIVDGGSVDKTLDIIDGFNDRLGKILVVRTNEKNFGRLFHEGAQRATGNILWFLYPEMLPKQGSARKIKSLMSYQEVVGGSFEMVYEAKNFWTRFFVKLHERAYVPSLLCLNPTIFVRRKVYEEMGGFRHLPAFEIHDFQRRLAKRGKFLLLVGFPVTVSLRKLEENISFPQIIRLGLSQILFWIGFPPSIIARIYSKKWTFT